VSTSIQTVTLAGQRFVIVPEADYRELVGQTWEPPLPQPDVAGNYPAVEAARVLLARKIIRRRRAAGLSQAELAKRAGVRAETLSRLEHAKHSPNVATVDKIVRALEQAEAVRPHAKHRPSGHTRRRARS
jgi:DNA-binding XRE family transcriptional regulator